MESEREKSTEEQNEKITVIKGSEALGYEGAGREEHTGENAPRRIIVADRRSGRQRALGPLAEEARTAGRRYDSHCAGGGLSFFGDIFAWARRSLANPTERRRLSELRQIPVNAVSVH
jgi:hypothetical protein